MLFWRVMARASLVLSVLIASPSDVSEERNAAVAAITEWNAAHSRRMKISLEPVRWETHSYPASGERPQGIINQQIVDDCDFLIGIFGLRVGTPTGKAQSGTIEEIERFRERGKHIALYFSIGLLPRDHDSDQLRALNEYHKDRQKDSLCGSFSTPDELRQEIARHLPSIVADVHKKLTTSGELKEVERELEQAQLSVSRDLKQLAAEERSALEGFIPLRVNVELERDLPIDDPVLRVTSNKHELEVTRLDYVDDHGVKLHSLKYHFRGQSVQVPLLQNILIDIWNRRSSNYHLTLRVTVTVAGEVMTHTLPIFAERRIRGNSAYIHVSG